MVGEPEHGHEDLMSELEQLRERVRLLEASSDSLEMLMAADGHRQRSTDALMGNLKQALEANRRQLESIARVQDRFLESRFETGPGIAIAARCRPCADVGGDFYFADRLSGGRTALCIADIAGHGAVAAVNMAIARSLLRVALSECEVGMGPSEVFMRLGQWLRQEFDLDQFVTMWLGVWDPATSELSFCSAAHPDAILWARDGEPRFLEADRGLPLGLAGVEAMPMVARSVRLEAGDRVFLYTDAWIETASADGRELMDEALLDFIGHAYRQPLQAVPDVLFLEFERHAANTRIRDDLSLMTFEIMNYES